MSSAGSSAWDFDFLLPGALGKLAVLCHQAHQAGSKAASFSWGPGTHGGRSQPRAAQADFPARRTAGRHSMAVRSTSDGRSADDRPDAVVASTPMAASAPESRIAPVIAAAAGTDTSLYAGKASSAPGRRGVR